MIAVDNVSYTYPEGTRALSGVDLRVRDGENLLIAGPNGSGKSTLAYHLNGLLLPTKGEVLVKGVPTRGNEKHARLHVGMVFQNPDDQIVGNTVREDVAFGPENLGLPRSEVEERVEEAMETMELRDFEDKSPHLLSGGQKRRVSIAGVLAMRPECLVLDDPLAGLDLGAAASVFRELAKLGERGYTIVTLSHRLERLWRLADRIIVLNEGRIVRMGTPSELFSDGVEGLGIGMPASWMVLRALCGEMNFRKG
ncbi:hypothetical protein AKJ37_03875 [candidate division MSBL1 archaeon SCGC-AAA259I09]|uniref:ABC transporter domain-containing protein n=1 Tax=candidate division MSBL1 archaeon SCGC-AAA259I09 TaxID=1698267 RepID=A0A133US24_9EURY|nr:hypothetical protein AKJ37_03875 [candidate division MSBL1 archaeon SCGC-AAA259I09]